MDGPNRAIAATSAMHRATRAPLIAFAALAAGCGPFGDDVRTAADASATIERYCVDCHNPEEYTGDFSFHQLDPADVASDADAWEGVVRKLRTGTMPPPE